ncbi:hypothetical protein HPB50_027430 [Hyalomma asiaticum]|uniref:Uncharacterized protein n=1 Tax=Hyalomma asiaticum TaxID=266040 RepID=A0ACB7SPX3_HYAAI|nr:hypothetical protein HPB50_027430 [Hyalomma asiaticum]
MPHLPTDDTEVVIRSKGGLNISKIGGSAITAAIFRTTGTPKEDVEWLFYECATVDDPYEASLTTYEDPNSSLSRLAMSLPQKSKYPGVSPNIAQQSRGPHTYPFRGFGPRNYPQCVGESPKANPELLPPQDGSPQEEKATGWSADQLDFIHVGRTTNRHQCPF